MILSVKLLGLAATLAEPGVQSVELDSGSKIADLLGDLGKDLGTHDNILSAATIFVNKQMADLDTVLSDGDEVLVMRGLPGG